MACSCETNRKRNKGFRKLGTYLRGMSTFGKTSLLLILLVLDQINCNFQHSFQDNMHYEGRNFDSLNDDFVFFFLTLQKN